MFAALLAFIIPSGSALAFWYDQTVYIQEVHPYGIDPRQGVINGLFDLTNAIKANTKASQDAQTQQQIESLYPECVRQVTAYINASDTYLKQTDQAINDYIATNVGKSHTPQEEATIADHLVTLYTLRAAQNQRYINLTIKQCSYSTLNAACIKSSGPNAEMKSYDATTGAVQCKCASGYVWNSSACVVPQRSSAGNTISNGNAVAVKPPVEQPTAPTSRPKETPPVVHKATAVTPPTTTVPKVSSTTESKETTTPVYHKGLVQIMWSWVIGLFGF